MYQENNSNRFQFIASLVALVLPVLQIFLNFLPDSSKGILLFNDYFLFVSIVAMVFSYIAIIAYKNKGYFELPISKKAEKEYRIWKSLTDPFLYNEQEIIENLRQKPYMPVPKRITPSNIASLIFIPIMIFSFIIFYVLGLFYAGDRAILVQSISYIVLIASTAISLAVYYIQDINFKRWSDDLDSRYQKIIDLCYKNKAFPELPEVSYRAQFENDLNLITIVKVNQRFYKIVSRIDTGLLTAVEGYDDMDTLIKEDQSRNE